MCVTSRPIDSNMLTLSAVASNIHFSDAGLKIAGHVLNFLGFVLTLVQKIIR